MLHPPMNQTENIYAMSPTFDFRAVGDIDTTRYTKAVYIALTANDSTTIYNTHMDTPGYVTFPLGGQFYPFRTDRALTGGDLADYTVIYCY